MLAPVQPRAPQDRGRVVIRREIQVISPLLGGGVHVPPDEAEHHKKQPDQVTPLRGAAVRGQLRFFWRATTGCRLSSLAEMWQREAQLWGATSRPGAVSLRIDPVPDKPLKLDSLPVYETRQSGSNTRSTRARSDAGSLCYGAFPLQPPAGKSEPPGTLWVLSGRAFLHLEVPKEQEAEVTLAVDAWLCLGGVGGRTRRGFGAVAVVEPRDAPQPDEVLGRLAGPPRLPGVPALGGVEDLALHPKSFPSACEALQCALNLLQRFRQGPGLGRKPGDINRPGRSHWPEAETIRRLTGQRHPRHTEQPMPQVFPRAAFGLPIIFHFKEGGKGPQSDPDDTRLQPQQADRMASPLQLRPYLCRDGSFGALALRLRGTSLPPLQLVEIKRQDGRTWPVAAELTQQMARQIAPLQGQPDVLQAFLTLFRQGDCR